MTVLVWILICKPITVILWAYCSLCSSRWHSSYEHLQTGRSSAIYTSKTIQNEKNICGNLTVKQILCSVKEIQCCAITADKATDAANQEQLSISIRFVHKNKPWEVCVFLNIAITILTQLGIGNYGFFALWLKL